MSKLKRQLEEAKATYKEAKRLEAQYNSLPEFDSKQECSACGGKASETEFFRGRYWHARDSDNYVRKLKITCKRCQGTTSTKVKEGLPFAGDFDILKEKEKTGKEIKRLTNLIKNKPSFFKFFS